MRIWTLDEIFRRWPSLWFRIVFELTLPTLAAITWGAKAFISNTGTFFSAFTAAGIAFTAVLYVQGQILRMAKNVRDEQNAEKWEGSFASLHDAIKALKIQDDGTTPRITPNPDELYYVDRVPGFRQSNEAIEKHLYYPAALMAAVGFEQAVRDLGEHIAINVQRPLPSIIQDLVADDKHLRERLRELVRLRNGIVHAPAHKQLADEKDAAEVLSVFKNGVWSLVDYLEDVNNLRLNPPEKYVPPTPSVFERWRT